MAIRQEEKIFIVTVHVECRIMLHYLEIQGCEEVGTPKRSSRMSTLYPMDHSDNIPPDLACYLLKVIHNAIICRKSIINCLAGK